MADIPPDDDWWLASDGKYYPPETHPDYVPPPEPAVDVPTAPTTAWEASTAPPVAEPPLPSTERPPAPAGAVTAPAEQPSSASPLLRLWWVPLLVGIVGLGVLLAISLGGDGESVATTVVTPTPGGARPTAVPDATPEAGSTPERPSPTEAPGDPTAVPPPRGPADVTPGGLATLDAPAAFGSVYGTDDWRFTVAEVLDADAAGLVSDFDDPLPEGMANLAIVYEIQYVGTELTAWDPLFFTAHTPSGSHDAFDGCFLDLDRLETVGVSPDSHWELVPGQRQRLAECVRVPVDGVDDVVIGAEYDWRNSVHWSADGVSLPALEPVDIEPGPPDVSTRAIGETVKWSEWAVTLIEVIDAEDAGLISEYATPSDADTSFVAVVYEVANLAAEDDFDPIAITALGRQAHGPFNGCFLDDAALVEIGLDEPFGDVPEGETKRTALCFALPTDDAGDVVYRIENFGDFDSEPAFFAAG